MRGLLTAVALAAAGCATPTWKDHLAGAGLPADKVVLVGSFVTVPPIAQRGVRTATGPSYGPNGWEPQGGVVFVGKMAGNVGAAFTLDLAEPWRQDSMGMPLALFDWAWFPMSGHFFVEVPRLQKFFLRGIFYVTDGGTTKIELPARVDVPPGARVVYVGELRLVRTGDRRTIVNDKLAEARRAAEAAGRVDLLAVPWKTSLLSPVEPRVAAGGGAP